MILVIIVVIYFGFGGGCRDLGIVVVVLWLSGGLMVVLRCDMSGLVLYG